jgi:hypothetical protein
VALPVSKMNQLARVRGILTLVTLAVTFGCAGQQLTPRGAGVRTLRGDPPQNCKELGIVEAGVQLGGCDASCQTTSMRNDAAALGANTLRIDAYLGKTNNASGTAFACPAL